ncbi:MAG: hypothetical protein ONB45_20835 [candidate division KSB1 bacterium]|nr:hypothetical protein [candidate division KSB1 bacterium]
MIYLECEPDKVLVSVLGIPSKEIKHAHSKGNVCNKLAKSSHSKGLVDEDPPSAQPSYIGQLRLHSHEHQIKLLYDEKAQNLFIVLCPRLEEWILAAAKEAGVDIQDYGLPPEANQLHKVINTRLGSLALLIESIKRRSKMLKSLEHLMTSI